MLGSIEILLKIQEIDLEIFRKTDRCRKIPGEIRKLSDHIEKLEENLDGVRTVLRDNKVILHEMEVEIDEFKEKVKKFKEQQSQVKRNEEYSALEREILRVKDEISDKETEALELIERNDKTEQEIVTLENELIVARKDLEEKSSVLRTELQELEKVLFGEKKIRDETAINIEKPLMKRYEQLRDSKNKLAIVALRNCSCSGCFAQIPLQVVANIKKNKEVIYCEHCGRILYAKTER